MPRTYALTPIIGEFRDELDSYDQWGSAMSLGFALCDAMWAKGEDIDPAVQFRPGAWQPASREDYLAENPSYAAAVAWDATEDQRRVALRIIHLWTEVLRAAGQDY